VPELPVLLYCFEKGLNPTEVLEEWDEYWINRLLALRDAVNGLK
jgi:hypothetical protein